MKIAILGAGISGLALAWFLKQQYGPNLSVTIIEKSNRVGGWIQTINDDGFLFELGPHSCRSQGSTSTATLQLIEALGLQDQVITPQANQKYLYLDGQIVPMPQNLLSGLFSPIMKGIPTALCRDFFTSRGPPNDESIQTFAERRFGKEVTQRLIDPLITGIYAGDINQLSVECCFPHWKESEKRYGSVLRGILLRKKNKPKGKVSAWASQILQKPFFSFKNGLSTLTAALEKELQENIVKNCTVTHLKFHQNGVVVNSADNKSWEVDHLYSTIPPAALASLLVAHRPALSILLQSIPTSSVAIASVGYNDSVLQKQGFGYLVPSKENQNNLGMIWDSSTFPQQNHYPKETRLTVIMGGPHHPQLMLKNDDELRSVAIDAIARHLHITAQPKVIHISRAKNAIPQYKVGHKSLTSRINQGLADLSPHITVLGSAFNGISINDCINSAALNSDFYHRGTGGQ